LTLHKWWNWTKFLHLWSLLRCWLTNVAHLYTLLSFTHCSPLVGRLQVLKKKVTHGS